MSQPHNRILTTHTGSLARPEPLRIALLQRDAGQPTDQPAFDQLVKAAVSEVVQRQVDIGLDIINDGEQGKLGFAAYLGERLSGFDGPQRARPVSLDARQFGRSQRPSGFATTRAACNGPVSWKDYALVERDIRHFKEATESVDTAGTFITAASPGTIANHHPNECYPSREAYLEAIAHVMKREYDAIVEAGFTLQLDCPDLAMRNTWFPDTTLAEFQYEIELNVDALNHATRDILPERMRMHVCWGAGEGPHNHDVELKDIVKILLRARPRALSVVGANGRHEHEWRLWTEVPLPDDKILIPGVVDNTTNIIEHPLVVAERLVRYCNAVGRDRVIAGVDCGFGTTVSNQALAVDPEVAWVKLQSLVEGAARASAEVW
jgi:5-methyltetrahydropteroyltriglutamate--homocysteine methyltransferase